MNQHKLQNSVLEKVSKWSANNTDSPSLLIPQDDGSFHQGYYSGMGTSENTPIEQLDPQYKATVSQLYISGKLRESGKAFTLCSSSDSFKKLVAVK